jgi:mannose-6-phosphate isomerase
MYSGIRENANFNKQLLRILPERVKRTYFGGREIDKFMGTSDGDGEYPEMWIASTVSANGSNPDEGLSKAVSYSELFMLKELIQKDPVGLLGKSHYMGGYGDNPGILVKMIDALNRLTIQVHPDLTFAKKIFGSDYGKTEGWYILNTRIDLLEEPYILLGFKKGITKEKWKKIMISQDVREMTDCLHKFPVCPGDIFFVEGGVPHAIGPGCCLLEIQEPTDYTLRAEMRTPEGKLLSERLIHQGAGFENLYDCFHYDGMSKEEAMRKWKLKARICEEPELQSTSIFSEKFTKTFGMERMVITGDYWKREHNRFTIAFVLHGTGRVETVSQSEMLSRGDILFIPAGVAETLWKAINSPLDIILCYPALKKRQTDGC